jgi:hypothetical protein
MVMPCVAGVRVMGMDSCVEGVRVKHGFKYHENGWVIMKIDKTGFTENRLVTI